MSASKTVNIENPHQFVLRSVKTKGLRPNTFNGKKTKGFQISVQVPDDEIEKIQEAWVSYEPKKQTPFFGLNGKNNMLTLKTMKLSDKMKKECMTPKSKDDFEGILVDIMFGIPDVYIDESGDKFPQLRLSGLKKVGNAVDETPAPVDDF